MNKMEPLLEEKRIRSICEFRSIHDLFARVSNGKCFIDIKFRSNNIRSPNEIAKV